MRSSLRITLPAVLTVATALVAACGGESQSAGAAADVRTVEVSMVDIAFKPETLQVASGEQVRFVFRNAGKVRHEAYIGTTEAQVGHAKDMVDGAAHDDDGHGGHGGKSDKRGDDRITLAPGKRGDLTYRFTQPGNMEIGCHEPGHYAAGMKITVEVA